MRGCMYIHVPVYTLKSVVKNTLYCVNSETERFGIGVKKLYTGYKVAIVN